MNLSKKDIRRIERVLHKAGYTNIIWNNGCIECDHPKTSNTGRFFSLKEPIEALGFYVPCSGFSGRYYAQVCTQSDLDNYEYDLRHSITKD